MDRPRLTGKLVLKNISSSVAYLLQKITTKNPLASFPLAVVPTPYLLGVVVPGVFPLLLVGHPLQHPIPPLSKLAHAAARPCRP